MHPTPSSRSRRTPTRRDPHHRCDLRPHPVQTHSSRGRPFPRCPRRFRWTTPLRPAQTHSKSRRPTRSTSHRSGPPPVALDPGPPRCRRHRGHPHRPASPGGRDHRRPPTRRGRPHPPCPPDEPDPPRPSAARHGGPKRPGGCEHTMRRRRRGRRGAGRGRTLRAGLAAAPWTGARCARGLRSASTTMPPAITADASSAPSFIVTPPAAVTPPAPRTASEGPRRRRPWRRTTAPAGTA